MDRLSFFTCAACILFLTGRCHCFVQVKKYIPFLLKIFLILNIFSCRLEVQELVEAALRASVSAFGMLIKNANVDAKLCFIRVHCELALVLFRVSDTTKIDAHFAPIQD